MPEKTNAKVMGDVPEAFFGLMRAQIDLGRELFEAWTGTPAPDIQDPMRALQQAAPRPVCHVPEPCWMPKKLGECRSHVGDCATACVRLVVTNCDRVRRTVTIRVVGDSGATASPTTLDLGPMERATVEVCRTIDRTDDDGNEARTRFENLIWVEGCRDHVLRWIVSVGTAGLDSCHEVAVDDCPDYRHHWYDHFYCVRGCASRDTSPREPNG